ncbi:hypothetical protein RhiirB3_450627 [Rhizophagus irregularis]|nr:hypothetical protein RhiirB3_450627 [Rhizophagus irregularis]
MLWFFNRYDNDSQKRFEDEERVDLSNFWQLRTSLHGCGTSLISIINSVLDFAKLEINRNNNKKKREERIDLVKLLEVSEVCFVGQQMVSAIYNDNNKLTNNNDEENLLMGNNNTANSMKFTKILISLASLSYSSLSNQYKKHAGVQDTTTTDTSSSSSNKIHALITITDTECGISPFVLLVY